jgi:hypothetical protein
MRMPGHSRLICLIALMPLLSGKLMFMVIAQPRLIESLDLFPMQTG